MQTYAYKVWMIQLMVPKINKIIVFKNIILENYLI